MQTKRFFSSFVLIVVLISVVFWFPRPIVTLVIAGIIGLGLWEFYALAGVKGYKPFRIYGICLGVWLGVETYLLTFSHWAGNESSFIYVTLFLIIASILIKYGFVKNNPSVIANSGITILGIMYVSFLFTFVIRIGAMPNSVAGKGWIMALFAITKASDISAYIFGSKLGRHKLISRISAKKTLEGSVFGVLGSILMAVLCRLWFLKSMSFSSILLLGILLSVSGQIGDLVESMLKRDAQVKDSGKLIPGMGGVLDIMDSVLFAAPVMYLYLKVML